MNNIFNTMIFENNITKEPIVDSDISNRYDLIDMFKVARVTGAVPKEFETEYFRTHKIYTVDPNEIKDDLMLIPTSNILTVLISVLTDLSLNSILSTNSTSDHIRRLVNIELEARKNKYYNKAIFFKISCDVHNINIMDSAVMMEIYENLGNLISSHNISYTSIHAIISDINTMTNEEFLEIEKYASEFSNLIRVVYRHSKLSNDEVVDSMRKLAKSIDSKAQKLFSNYGYLFWKTSLQAMIYSLTDTYAILNVLNLKDDIEDMGILESHVNNNSHEIDDERDERELNEIIQSTFDDKILDFFLDDETDTETDINTVSNLMRIANVRESGMTSKILSKTNKAQSNSKKTAGKIKQITGDTSRIAKSVKGIIQPFNDLVTNTFHTVRKMDENSRREAVVSGSVRKRLIRLIRLGIKIALGGGALSVLGPVGGALTILAGIAIDSKIDFKVRQDILSELEMEHRILKEKLDDSRGDNDKKAKYELMRLEGQLEKEIRRIKMTI